MSETPSPLDYSAAYAQLGELSRAISQRREEIQAAELAERELYFKRLAEGDGFALARARDVLRAMSRVPGWNGGYLPGLSGNFDQLAYSLDELLWEMYRRELAARGTS